MATKALLKGRSAGEDASVSVRNDALSEGRPGELSHGDLVAGGHN